jgi:hypothetical protein
MNKIPLEDMNKALHEYNESMGIPLKDYLYERFKVEELREAKDEGELFGPVFGKIIERNLTDDDF